MKATETSRHTPGQDATAAAGLPVYAVLSVLLSYPQEDMIEALPELQLVLRPQEHRMLQPLFQYLARHDLIELQENYVNTFDRRRAHSLHLFEHIHGDSRDRGQAMVDLRDEYLRNGLVLDTSELPDYVPLFLEFLAQLAPAAADAMLGEAIHVLARLGGKLTEANSPYAAVFLLLRELCDVTPQALPEVPEEDLDEAMVTFGPGAGGSEPALKAYAQGLEQPVQFYPPGSAARRQPM